MLLKSFVSESTDMICLKAIREHKFVNILDDPGSADLSAYVDFPSIKHSAEEASGSFLYSLLVPSLL